MTYFNACKTLDELKKEYRRLAMLHHPDRGGNLETMKAINDEHDRVFEILKAQHNATAKEDRQTTETAEEFRDIIDLLLKLDGLTVELCGSWLWISGETMQHKEALKAAGCRWSANKKMWYWRHAEDGARRSRGGHSINRIRAKYGSQVFTASGEYQEYEAIGAGA